MTDTPVLCCWTGEAMEPAGPYWTKVADRQWTVGERYAIEVREERSSAAHRAYFAAVRECWMNLPDDLAQRFVSETHLRKAALIATGFRDEVTHVASSKAEAQRFAAFVRKLVPADDYAVVSVSGSTVVVLTAKSQSMRAMGKAEFMRSKDAVLDYLAAMIGVTPATLAQQGEAA